MTLKELLDKVSFKDIATELPKFDKETVHNMWLFKQAYDRLRSLPVGNDDGNAIEVKGWSVWSPSRVYWTDELARQVKCAKSATLKKVAAAILWELTFYGFDLDDVPDFCAYDFASRFEYGREYDESELDENPYRREWTELWQQVHDIQCLNPEDVGKRTFSNSPIEDIVSQSLSEDQQKELDKLEAELETLERKMRRYDLSTELIEQCGFDVTTAEALRSRLMEAPPFTVDTIKAICKPEESADYLVDVIRQWFPSLEGSESLVIIQCPATIDLKDVCESVHAAFGSFRKIPHPKYLVAPSHNVKEATIKVIVFQ